MKTLRHFITLWLALALTAGAQTKISELPSLTGAAAATGDLLPIVDISAGAAGSKKITLAEFFLSPPAVRLRHALNVMDYGATGDGVADDTAEIQAALDAAEDSTSVRTVYLPPGSYKCNLTIPPGVNLIGAGTALDGLDPALQITTELIPASDASPVVYLPVGASNQIADFHIEGSGSTVAGIRVGNGSLIAGISAKFSRIRVKDCLVGVEVNFAVGMLFEHVHCNQCGWGWKFKKLADTCQLVSCGANWFTSGGIDLVNSAPAAGSARQLIIMGGEWGNGTGPWIEASSAISTLIIIGANVESIDHDYLISTDYVNLQLDSVSINVAAANPDQVSYIRQTDGVAQITIKNHVWLGGTPGYIWEGVAGMIPPTVIGYQTGTFRYATDNTFTTTSRLESVGNIALRASRTSNQTALASGSTTVVTYAGESGDTSSNFDPSTGLFTAPSAGIYTMAAGVILNTAVPAGYARMIERHNGADGEIMHSLYASVQYDGLTGSITKRLAAGDTWGIGVAHNLGSDISLFASTGNETWIRVAKVSN